jgi:hypothetical protein
MYLTVCFESDNGKQVEAEICLDMDDYCFELEELSIDGTAYPVKEMSFQRRHVICKIIEENVDIPARVSEELQNRREQYELSFND